jgi:hypothetical protein
MESETSLGVGSAGRGVDRLVATTTEHHRKVPAPNPVKHHMGYPLRYFEAGRLCETTSRAIHSRLLLRPSEELNTIIRGIIARGVRMYGVEVSYFISPERQEDQVGTPPRCLR